MRLGRHSFLTILFAAFSLAASPPRRIVSLSPDMTEMLYGVGAFSRVVGVSDYDAYPPEAARLPRLGQFHHPSLEKLTAMRPDLVVINSAQAPFLQDALSELGLRILKVSNRSVQEVYAAIIALGRATGHESEAGRLASATRRGLEQVVRRSSGRPRPGVVIIVDRIPGTLRDLFTATEGSFLAELVGIAGGNVIVKPAGDGYKRLAKEDLLALDPDVILDFIHGAKSRLAGDPMEAWREMPELRAVRNRRVYSINQDFVPHASQRIVQTAELFARLLHPEIQ